MYEIEMSGFICFLFFGYCKCFIVSLCLICLLETVERKAGVSWSIATKECVLQAPCREVVALIETGWRRILGLHSEDGLAEEEC